MNHWKLIGWLLIGAAVFVLLTGIGFVLMSKDASGAQAGIVLGGLLIPLGLQVAFGIFMLRRSQDTPND